MNDTKIAFVTPWYGENAPGGAEAETRHTAERLLKAGLNVEVLTTCIRDFYGDWSKNHYRQGKSIENGVNVRRFKVKRRNQKEFDQVNWRLINNLPLDAGQEQIYIGQMIQSPALYRYIENNVKDYLFIFIPYMFSTTYFGAQIAPERSLLIPCLHDESYARLNIFRELLPQLKALVFHTKAEAELANRLYGAKGDQLRPVLGEGIDTEWSGNGDRFRQKYGLGDRFMLYAGRREPGKNTNLLIDYWRLYHRQSTNTVKLVLIGPGDIDQNLQDSDGILDLGFLPIQDKYDAFAAADIFCIPSVHESFSRSLMESWLAGTPALVHADCAVTREHSHLSNGGLYFREYEEFAATADYLFEKTGTAKNMGQLGRQYVLENFTWDKVLDGYNALFKEVLAE